MFARAKYYINIPAFFEVGNPNEKQNHRDRKKWWHGPKKIINRCTPAKNQGNVQSKVETHIGTKPPSPKLETLNAEGVEA